MISRQSAEPGNVSHKSLRMVPRSVQQHQLFWKSFSGQVDQRGGLPIRIQQPNTVAEFHPMTCEFRSVAHPHFAATQGAGEDPYRVESVLAFSTMLQNQHVGLILDGRNRLAMANEGRTRAGKTEVAPVPPRA